MNDDAVETLRDIAEGLEQERVVVDKLIEFVRRLSKCSVEPIAAEARRLVELIDRNGYEEAS